jgi:hypothetical protein
MIFANKDHRFKFYFFMFFFISSGICLISAYFFSMEASLSERMFWLYVGINFSVTGLGLLTFLIYYFSTRNRKKKRVCSLEFIELNWIWISFLIFSIFAVYFKPNQKLLLVGYGLFSIIILVSFIGIGIWLHDRKAKHKLDETVRDIQKLIDNQHIRSKLQQKA